MSLDAVLARIQQLQPPPQPAAPVASPPAAAPTSPSFSSQLQTALQAPAAPAAAPAPAAAQPAPAPAPAATTAAPAESPLHDVGCCCCCCGRPATVEAAQTAAPVTAPAPAPAAAAPGGAPTAYDAEIQAAGARYGVDPDLVKAVIQQESGFDPTATSPVGAQGLMQLMPETASGLGIADAYDPAQAIDAGTRYLKAQLDRFGGDESLALAAYNAGPGAVEQYGGIPPYDETQNYVRSVLANLASFKNTSP